VGRNKEKGSSWQAEMSEFFVADGPPDQSFAWLEEIFHLD
jgi:L-rhamnose mutarotase